MNTDSHPVSQVQWVSADSVVANDYNPNAVADPEMELLETSIKSDGYTQPIVVWDNGENYEVIDGFHRQLVGKRLGMDLLPIVVVNSSSTERNDRIASTIRHNRARGKHRIDSMSEIVVELSKRNWGDEKIAKELGMDADEVLRLKQVSGLSELFEGEEFSEAWEPSK